MITKLKILLPALVLLAAGLAFAQAGARGEPDLKVSGSGRRLVVRGGGLRRLLDVKDEIHAARLEEVKLLLVTRRKPFTYLVVDACGPSKAVPDARRCGAADECALLWIKLDAAWKMSAIRVARYESCWQSSSSSDGFKISGRKLTMEYDNFSESKSYKLSYDAEEPEGGFRVEESPLSDAGSD